MKVSIFAEGGGMRCAYSLGVIDALYSHYGLRRVDVCLALSGSVPNLAYFTSGQFYPGFFIWPNEVTTSDVLGFWHIFTHKPLLDIDYIVNNIFHFGKNPLDINAMFDSRVEFIIPLSDSKTGEPFYLSTKNKFNGFNPWDVLRASMALPFVYKKTIKLGNKTYYDGSYANPLPIDHPSLNGTKRIIILTKDLEHMHSEDFFEEMFGFIFKSVLDKGVYSDIKNYHRKYEENLEKVINFEKEGHIVIRPKVKFSAMNNSKENISKCIEAGRNDAILNKNLKKLILEMKKSEKKNFYFGTLNKKRI